MGSSDRFFIYLQFALAVVGGFLAISAWVIRKKPEAEGIVNRLIPYQAFVGLGLLGVGLILLVKTFRIVHLFRGFTVVPLLSTALVGLVVGGILLGFMFAMPQIAKWAPGESTAEAKGMEVARKLAPFHSILGIIALASASVFLLYRLGVMKG